MTDGDTIAIIVAAGYGSRFGDARAKQFVELCGRPLLAWSVLAFAEAPSVAGIVVVGPEGRERELHGSIVAPLAPNVPTAVVEGGNTRQASVARGLDAAFALATAKGLAFDLAAVHDGARPLVTALTIEQVIDTVRSNAMLDGAIAAAPVTDTLKRVDVGADITATVDRARLWAAMTPQVFRAHTIRDAHAHAAAQGFAGTDDASLVEWLGGRIACVATPRDNLKVTVPEDLAIARALLGSRVGA